MQTDLEDFGDGKHEESPSQNPSTSESASTSDVKPQAGDESVIDGEKKENDASKDFDRTLKMVAFIAKLLGFSGSSFEEKIRSFILVDSYRRYPLVNSTSVALTFILVILLLLEVNVEIATTSFIENLGNTSDLLNFAMANDNRLILILKPKTGLAILFAILAYLNYVTVVVISLLFECCKSSQRFQKWFGSDQEKMDAYKSHHSQIFFSLVAITIIMFYTGFISNIIKNYEQIEVQYINIENKPVYVKIAWASAGLRVFIRIVSYIPVILGLAVFPGIWSKS